MSILFRLSNSVVLRASQSAWQSPKSSSAVLSCFYKTSAPQHEQSSTPSLVPGEDYWKKNERLKRPTSPHLTIYKPQLTSMLSITHRGTGLYMSAVLSGFGIGMMLLPNSFPYYVALMSHSQLGLATLFVAKFALAFPFNFHLFNGVRHLIWDMGYGFSLRALYKSGYGVSVAALVASLGLAMM